MSRTLLAALIAGTVHAFNLYPSMNVTSLASAFNITPDCLNALNATINCDQATFSMVGSVHSYQWDQGDLTTLCTSDCNTTAQQWQANVTSACSGQQMNLHGAQIAVDTISGRYVDGLDVACLKSTTNQSNFCLLESQEWSGNDAIQSDNATDPANTRLANLYSDDLLCSDCFVNMLATRLRSPYLPVEDHSEYLIAEFQDVQDVCSTTVSPPLTTRAAPTITILPTASATSTTGANGTMPGNGTCPSGQLISDDNNSNSKSKRSIYPYTPQKGSPGRETHHMVSHLIAQDNTNSAANSSLTTVSQTYCDQLSVKYGVATGDLQSITDADDCSGACGQCFPARCDVQKLPTAQTCDAAANMLSTAANNITTYQLLAWNPNIIGLCDSLQAGQYICVSPPNGESHYALINSPLNGTANAGSQARGGGDGGGDASSSSSSSVSNSSVVSASAGSPSPPTTGSIAPSTTPAPSAPGTTASATSSVIATQSGIAAGCKKYALAKAGDNCVDFAKTNNVDINTFYSLNTILNEGQACGTQFQSGENYCVQR